MNTSKEVKQLLMQRFGWLECVASAYELPNLNSADFIVVKYGGVVQEYEIKLSRADLMGEMRCARVAKGLNEGSEYLKKQHKLLLEGDQAEVIRDIANKSGHATSLSRSKLEKHKLYIGNGERMLYGGREKFVPSVFYWCIPYRLLKIAEELNKGLPYGIYVFDIPTNRGYNTTHIYKRPTSLKPQGHKIMEHMANRLHTLLCEARSTIANLEATDYQRLSESSGEHQTLRELAPKPEEAII